MRQIIALAALLITAALTISWARPPAGSAAPPRSAAPAANATGSTFAVPGGRLRIEVCADDIVRVAFAKDDAFFARPSLMAAPRRCTSPAWKLTQTEKAATIATAKLRVNVDLATGAVAFADAAGRPVLSERWNDANRTLTVGKRQGDFPGMLARRTFQVVLVRPERAVPFSFTLKADASVSYAGQTVAVRF